MGGGIFLLNSIFFIEQIVHANSFSFIRGGKKQRNCNISCQIVEEAKC